MAPKIKEIKTGLTAAEKKKQKQENKVGLTSCSRFSMKWCAYFSFYLFTKLLYISLFPNIQAKANPGKAAEKKEKADAKRARRKESGSVKKMG